MTRLLLLTVLLHDLAPKELEEKGRTHLYNLEFEAARDVFAELGRRAPRSPAGPYYEATALWMEEFTRRGGMAGSTFRTGRYWLQKRQEPPDRKLARNLEKLVEESIARSEAILEAFPEDREALFFLGSAEGLRSAFHASIEHAYYRAYRAGSRAKEIHERLLEIDPDYADACLLPGIYEYTVATLPRSLRIVGFFIGLRGSREKGLALVEKSVERGHRSRWVARLSLSVMYQREKKYRRALRIVRQLEVEFPRNPLLPFERGSIHLLRKDFRSARRIFARILDEQRLDTPNFDAVEPSLVHLKLGESYLFAKSYARASEEFERALRIPDVPDRIRAPIFLRRGMASDARGQRAAAQWDYRRAIELDADKLTEKLANRYLKRPYR